MVTTQQLLDFEAAHPGWSGGKDLACVDELGLKPARYYQLLHRAVLTREALEHDPATTNRVFRQIEDEAPFTCRIF